MAEPDSNRVIRRLLPTERLLYESELACVGEFRCDPARPDFRGGTPCTSWCFVFPRTSVWITHEAGRRFVGDPSVVTFYNRDDIYWRSRISPEGDRADWFAFAPDVVLAAAAERDPAIVERPMQPFRFERAPTDPGLYVAQRAVHDALASGSTDSLDVDEAAIHLLGLVVGRAYASRSIHRHPQPNRRLDLIEGARALIAEQVSDRLPLNALAKRLDVSPYHLCRAFRRQSGWTLSEYRLQLRLRMSLERIASGQSLADLAFELGFSSHSHFGAAFRRVFGVPPTAIRASSARHLRELGARAAAMRSPHRPHRSAGLETRRSMGEQSVDRSRPPRGSTLRA